MIVDELILKLQADLQDVKKALKNVESEAAKTGKEAGAQMGKGTAKVWSMSAAPSAIDGEGSDQTPQCGHH